MMARTALLAAVLTGAAIPHGTGALSVGTAFSREPRSSHCMMNRFPPSCQKAEFLGISQTSLRAHKSDKDIYADYDMDVVSQALQLAENEHMTALDLRGNA